MTTSIATELNRSRASTPLRALDTFDDALATHLDAMARRASRVSWPSKKYRDDPVRFFREILGVEPWSKQLEIIEAIRAHKRVAVKSGHKVSKSHTLAGVALWFYCSFPDARVIMTSTTSRQVDDILWRESRMMRARCGLCVECKKKNEDRPLSERIEVPCEHSAWIDGDMGEMARTGLKSEDFREVKGFTAREAEAVAGISGRHLLYLLDEASGIKAEIYEAIEGNRAGGARVCLAGNPTKTSGEFYDAFNGKARFYSTHTISSEDTPNNVYGDDDPRAIPGLAGREWIEEKEEEWGRESALFKVRVLGEFAELEEGKIFSIHTIAEAEGRWHDTLFAGRLRIGLDVAGSGVGADECVWAPCRGQKIGSLVAMRGLTPEAIVMHTVGMVRDLRLDRELPVVVLDREGKVGAEVYGAFSSYLASKEEPEFELLVVRASDRAHRDPLLYDRQRDCLAGVFLDWIRDGGAIPSDTKLAAEMHAFEWREQVSTGRVKITPKVEVKKLLKRSPDRYDACVLAVWIPTGEGDGGELRKSTLTRQEPRGGAMDAYAGAAKIDPYGAM